MKRSVVFIACLAVVFAVSGSAATAGEPRIIRIGVRPALEAGRYQVTLCVYAASEGGTPLASESRWVEVGASGAFTVPLGSLGTADAGGAAERWLGVRVMPRPEQERVRVDSVVGRPVTVQVVTDAAITANGIIESIAQGFRFPDGSVQTSAATVSGGVPSVNGIGAAVTIAGAATVSVGTAGSTITVSGPGFGSPVSVGSANAAGTATTIVRSDHVHAHGNQAGGTLHSAATTGAAGFLSAADKTKLDGTVAYVRTVIVSPVVGDTVSSGGALLSALSSISGNSSTNSYLLKIEPGVYDIGSNPLTMKSYVDIEGSGENATFITATCGSNSFVSTAAAVIGAANSELRNLTLTNTSSLAYGVGFWAGTSGAMRISNVTMNSTGATNTSYGVRATSSAVLTAFRATITATGVGGSTTALAFQSDTGTTISILNSTLTGKGVGGTGNNFGFRTDSSTCVATVDGSTIAASGTATTNYAVYNSFGTITITNSTVRVDTNASRIAISTNSSSSSIVKISHSLILAFNPGNASALSISKGSSSTVRVGASLVDSSSVGTPTCVHVYDQNFTDLNNVCPIPLA